MAKTFGDIKIGDIIYSLYVYTYNSAPEKGNCEEAYRMLGMDFNLANYPTIGEINTHEVVDINPSAYNGCETLIYAKNNTVNGTVLIIADNSNKTFTRQFITGTHYQVFAVDVDSLKEKVKKIIHAMEVVNKNIMVVKSNKYKEMLEKLKAL